MQHLTHRSVTSPLLVVWEHCTCKVILLCIIMQPFLALSRIHLQECGL